MKTIHLASTNTGKLASMRRHLEGVDVEIVPIDLPLIEPQASTIEEVATSKAEQAAKLLHKPVVIEDSGFFITALKGFPGPYSKYVNETIEIEGLIKLMEGVEDRACGFTSVLVYIDEHGEKHVFTHQEPGTLALAVDQTPCEHSWSRMWHIFIPAGHTETLNILKNQKHTGSFEKIHSKSSFGKFGLWMKAEIAAGRM